MGRHNIGGMKLTGKIVREKINGEVVEILVPTKRISYEEGNRRVERYLKKKGLI